MTVTIERILELDDNSLQFRFSVEGAARRRPPSFDDLVGFIRTHFAGTYEATVQPWSVEPYRMYRRIRHVTGRVRHGFKLEVWPDAQPWGSCPVFSHVTCETYRTNCDIVRWIAHAHRENAGPATAAEPDGPQREPVNGS